uniref:Uncharacterized protein n=1 Tax=Schizaphis graminum TaxID=13262 RepID=A0A2S2NV24_SCHGA
MCIMIVRHQLYSHFRSSYTIWSTVDDKSSSRVRSAVRKYTFANRTKSPSHARVRRPGKDEKKTLIIIISGAILGLRVYRWRVPTTGSHHEWLEKKGSRRGISRKGTHAPLLPPVIPSGLRWILILTLHGYRKIHRTF